MTRLDEIKARLERATPGPWRRSGLGSWHELLPEGETIVGPKSAPYEDDELEANAMLIRNSRADLEWAVAEIERLRKLVGMIDEEAEL